MLFLIEKRSEPYKWYGEASITDENTVLRQELLRGAWLRQGAGRRGV